MKQINEIMGKLIVVSCDASTVSGTVSRDEKKRDEVFTAGSVKYISPSELRSFLALRASANRVCLDHGTRFLSGYAIPEESIAAVMDELETIAKKYEEKRHDLVLNFNQYRQEWRDLHPEIAEWEHRFPDAAWVGSRISFSIGAFRISPSDVVLPKHAGDSLLSGLAELPRRVIEEVAQDVRDSWNPSAQRAVRIHDLLARITNKIRTLSFLGGDLAVIGAMVAETIDRLPKQGMIEGADYGILWSLLTTLSDPERALEMAQRFASKGIELFETEPEKEAVVEDLTLQEEPVAEVLSNEVQQGAEQEKPQPEAIEPVQQPDPIVVDPIIVQAKEPAIPEEVVQPIVVPAQPSQAPVSAWSW